MPRLGHQEAMEALYQELEAGGFGLEEAIIRYLELRGRRI